MSKQTTYQRIRELLLSGVATIARPYPDLGTQMDADQAARVIADEIDGLTERNAFLLTSAETAQAKLAEARAQFMLLDDEQASANDKANERIAALEPLATAWRMVCEWVHADDDGRTWREFVADTNEAIRAQTMPLAYGPVRTLSEAGK